MKNIETLPERVLRCAIYIRVSTAEQAINGKSLTAQKECLTRYAEENHMTIVGVFADEGQTARKELKKRKAIHALLQEVREDKIDVILFWKMDRWFRNVADFYKVQDILDAHQVKWIAVAEPNINMETRDGRLSLNLVLSIGQNEVDTTSERIKFTVDNMINNGRVVWGDANLPMGYKIGIVDGKKQVVKNEKEAPMVKEFFSFFLAHGAKRKTVVHMQETFGIDFSYMKLRTMLSSEFYIGKYRNNPNYCPAYLTIEEWNEIQRISKSNIKIAPSGRIYYFSGLMRCPECGQKLGARGGASIINKKTGEKRVYCYYRCNNACINNLCSLRHNVSQNLVEEYLLKNLEMEYEKYKISIQHIAEKKKQEKKQRSPQKIQGELERLNLLFQKGRIEFDYYNTEYEKLEKELSEVSNLLPLPKKDFSPIEQILNSDFRKIYAKLDQENRRSFWHSIIAQIHLTEKHKIDHIDFL